MSCLSHFGLRERPFEGNTNVRFFYVSQGHGEALARLRYLVRDRNMGIGVLTGEIGSGKTITRNVLEKMLDTAAFRVISLESSNLPFVHLLAEFIRQLEGHPPDLTGLTKYELLFRFRKLVLDRVHLKGRHLAVFLDEVQQMHPRTLDELKNLTNLSGGGENLLTMILVGQPEFRDVLNAMPQLDQRVSLRFHLNFLAGDEVGRYIEHRLRMAGRRSADPVFEPEAMDLVYRESQGIPRLVNRICKLSLDQAYSLQAGAVSGDVVAGIIDDLHLQKGDCREVSRRKWHSSVQ
ncbi:general secretion pathway protein A [Desulfobaculum xiamenense]|uniref:General secretion pathway protein A n=1 Tax=Desulfobaculum xiamenense TaxID=995050 RepID=A0A846QUP4_9BACT|nr:AAA family ATPase [Desulfobaculum xiamenense]NJB68369.1 general secretion pathway protein A [Desulfobaculum xiamenense]